MTATGAKSLDDTHKPPDDGGAAVTGQAMAADLSQDLSHPIGYPIGCRIRVTGPKALEPADLHFCGGAEGIEPLTPCMPLALGLPAGVR